MAKNRASTKRTAEKRRRYEGPVEWLFPMLEEAYTRLGPRDVVEPALVAPSRPAAARTKPARAIAAAANAIRHEEKLVEGRLAQLDRSYWEDVLREYHERRVGVVEAQVGPAAAALISPAMPALPGQNNWTPLGPSVVARGQTGNRAAISGRVAGIAIAPGGQRVYAATANGGVWRSDDGGVELAPDDGRLRHQPDELRHHQPRLRRHRHRPGESRPRLRRRPARATPMRSSALASSTPCRRTAASGRSAATTAA